MPENFELTAQDRVALRHLVEAYASGADSRSFRDVAALFADDATMEICLDERTCEVSSRRSGREEIAASLAGLDRYRATTHVIGSHLAHASEADRAVAETTCVAYHVDDHSVRARLDVMGISYSDTFVRIGERWLFAERRLQVTWREQRPLEQRPLEQRPLEQRPLGQRAPERP